jgi:RNA-directed DNA polymerase
MWEDPLKVAKQYCISKNVVMDAWRKVKSNSGSAGVDGKSVEDFEKNLKDNLYKIWNRMSSGTYFPPPVLTVSIPKKSGGERKLGIPTVADRVAQMVAKFYFEPMVEPSFHDDSYGYRPGKSAHQAIAVTRQRCWRYDWVLEFDVRGMFDNIDHELLMKAVRKHTDNNWILLYIERWLKSASQDKDGKIIPRTCGVPQGGVISPVLANLFMHYTFDTWMTIQHPALPFCRYADDGLIHCRSKSEAQMLKADLSRRFAECKLELHPVKTKIVNCKNFGKASEDTMTKFDFLGFQFRRRLVRAKSGKTFVGFTPAISPEAATAIRKTIRSWKLSRTTHLDIKDLAHKLNPIIRGWIQYYGKFNRSELYKVLRYLDMKLLGWVKRKYKKHGSYTKRPKEWLGKVSSILPNLFAHWRFVSFSG